MARVWRLLPAGYLADEPTVSPSGWRPSGGTHMQEVDLPRLEQDFDESQNMYLTFDVAGETYAVNIRTVTTIVGMQRVSEIPDLPNYIRGVMNLRGKVIPVMDMRLRFGLPWKEYDDRTTIIVLDAQDASTGLVVDKVNDVVTIVPEQISAPPRRQASGEKGVIQGLGKLENQVCVILDIAHLMLEIDASVELPLENAVVDPVTA
jgi:purine-binding chemotaxis protein CheW